MERGKSGHFKEERLAHTYTVVWQEDLGSVSCTFIGPKGAEAHSIEGR